ncbi:MAG: tyrosine-type recombinase/integrase [Candidatus Riflebacteria bacterium]|nr:tyrosine-type recombinase/integrase [Candidatus Riflebacteria bacterium]
MPDEMRRLIAAAGAIGRNGHRDSTLVLTMYRHALRVGEAVLLEWGQVDFGSGTLHVYRKKGGKPAAHPIEGDELRALRRLRTEQEGEARWVFMSERGAPITERTAAHIVARAGDEAGLENVHPHMLRHSAGYYLANKGCDTRLIQDYLGHKEIRHTVRYTELSPRRFRGLWRE